MFMKDRGKKLLIISVGARGEEKTAGLSPLLRLTIFPTRHCRVLDASGDVLL
jgi:hypothetical protein